MKSALVAFAVIVAAQANDDRYRFQPEAGQQFDRLMTTWRGLPDPYGFYPIPRTEKQAQKMGWVKLSSCEDNNEQ